jgi:hypothetical protein
MKGYIFDPEGKHYSTEGFISHGEWLRNKRPEYEAAFLDLLKAHPRIKEIEEGTLDEDEEGDIQYDLEQQLLAKALNDKWTRARAYEGRNGTELAIQHGGVKPSRELIAKVYKLMQLDPLTTALWLEDAEGGNSFSGSFSDYSSDENCKQVLMPHLLDAVYRRF